MQTLELLAPAKNIECGKAAIDHGADAVYIGANRFGARAAAGNSVSDIAELCQYAHLFGAKVYATLNTIIYDDELADSVSLACELDKIGIDAILIQDMGLVAILKTKNLKCDLHASTQTDNRTRDKVEWLYSNGFNRIVLARELSIEEIRSIHQQIPDAELEVFVHGALCVSYSGQCYASQYCFKRSANRGECAQFCRLAFTLKDANDNILEEDRHLLSLKDFSQIDNLEALAEAGAISFKIEGRLKDVEYVKNITAAYSERLNAIIEKNPKKYRRASFGQCKYTFTPNIAKSFNRGFTTYFANGRQHSLVSFDTPKAMGEYVGKVKEIRGKSFNVAGTASFTNGDGLCFIDSDRRLVGFRVNKVEGNRIYPLRLPAELRPGTQLFRNNDQSFTNTLSKSSAERKLWINFNLYTEDNSIFLIATDECNRSASVSVQCELQRAQQNQEENIRKQLSKLGNTIFYCKAIEVTTSDFIPSSMLSSLRRDVIEKLLLLDNVAPSCHDSATTPHPLAVHAPAYSHKYLYNASNEVAQTFYNKQGTIEADSFETQSYSKEKNNLLMQCRYCLKFEMGYCTKEKKRTPWREPLRLCLPDGKEFQIHFDCKKCQMNILSR